MEADVAVLKQRANESDRRMERMEQKLDQILDRLGQTATKATVWSALGTGAVLSFTVVATFTGVLNYSQDQRIATRSEPSAAIAAPQPIIIQLPPWPTAPPALPSPASPG